MDDSPVLSSPRLGHTKAAVQAALADDFDTVRAVDAVMDLVHHGNRQLKAATEVTPGTRSPALQAAPLPARAPRAPHEQSPPEGGAGGGTVVATGTPEEVAEVAGSYTGQFLKKKL